MCVRSFRVFTGTRAPAPYIFFRLPTVRMAAVAGSGGSVRGAGGASGGAGGAAKVAASAASGKVPSSVVAPLPAQPPPSPVAANAGDAKRTPFDVKQVAALVDWSPEKVLQLLALERKNSKGSMSQNSGGSGSGSCGRTFWCRPRLAQRHGSKQASECCATQTSGRRCLCC